MDVRRELPLAARSRYEHAVRDTCEHCLEARANPMPEGFDYTCCVPRALTLAGLAVALASDGVGSDTWRADAVAHGVEPAALDQAESCMRTSGIWPWEHE
jgi:hypothetical protein